MKETLTETLTNFLNQEEDLTKLNDPKYKSEFFDRIEKQTKQKRISIEATYSKVIGKVAQEKGHNADEFRKKKPRKFSGALNITTNTEKKQVTDTPPALGGGGMAKPPSQVTVNPQAAEPLPMASIAGSAHSFFRAIQPDLEELTSSEKEDVGICLNMVIGDWLSGHDEARKILGVVGLMGIYGGKIRVAMKKKKERRKKEEKEEKKLEEKINPKVESEFRQEAMKTLQENPRYQFLDDV